LRESYTVKFADGARQTNGRAAMSAPLSQASDLKKSKINQINSKNSRNSGIPRETQ